MKNREVDYALFQLEKAIKRLDQGVQAVKDDLDEDGVLQRFEFTFELFWKTLKVFLNHKGVIAKTPKDCLQESFRLGWLANDQVFVKMLEDRNLTSHVYSQEKSRAIFKSIQTEHLAQIQNAFTVLKALAAEPGF